MKYSDKITYQVDYINTLLKGYNEKPIFDNDNFTIDEMSWEEYLKINFKKADSIRFDIICSSNEFQINIDRANEALDLSSSNFISNVLLVKDFFDFLFKCRAKVEYCGSNYTKIYFYDQSGICVKTLKYSTGLYFKAGCKTKEYSPIYRK